MLSKLSASVLVRPTILYGCQKLCSDIHWIVIDGQRVLSAGADQYLKVLDVNTGTEIYSKSAGEGLR